ncbi:MAG: AAA family ATPase [Pseudonocardiales bacterium]
MAEPGALLERERQLTLLDETIAAVRARGRGQLVLLGGEGGVGKTALLQRFCAGRAGSERILWGGCDSLFTPRPLGPFLDIAHAIGGEFQQSLDDGAKPHEVATCLVRRVAAQGPTIVVIEDLHWADEATLDVLRLLARPVEKTPMLIVATYRNDELDRLHPLRLVLGELRSGQTTRRLDLDPLSLDAVEQLASQSGVDGNALYRTTAGNPFFVTEALAAEAGTIPSTIRDAVLGRAARLGAAARVVLDAVAVAPPQAEMWLVTALAGDAAQGLDDCLSVGMLTQVPGGVAFRHELARRAVEESLPPLHRSALHRKALDTLAAPPSGTPDLTRLAHHAEAADDSAAVMRYAPAAGRHAASVGAHREAAAQYARALRFAGASKAQVRAELLESLSHEHYLTDQMQDAIDALERALVCWRELGETRRQSAALCALSRRFWCTGRKGQAESVGREALTLLDALPPSRELGLAYCNLSQIAMNSEDAEAAMSWGARAVELGEHLDDTEVTVHALNNMGTIQVLTGAGTAMLERSLRLAEQAGLDEHVGRAYNNLTWGLARTRSYDLAHWFEDGINACGERGLELWRLYVLVFRARYDLDQGRWTEATEAAAAVLRYQRSALLVQILALSVVGVVRARRGDPEPWEPLDQALTMARQSDDLQWHAPVVLARAEAAWLDGRGPGAPWVTGELLLWRRLAGVDEVPPGAVAAPFAAQLRGDWATAAALWTARGCRYEAGLARAESENADEVRHALDDLQQLGARPAAAIVARRLRERGVKNVPRGPRPATQSNPGNLTSRERGVLELVAQGLPNSQIAQRLFVSTKTVDKHVSAALRKLGARSRAEASAEAVRLGIAEPDRTG